MTIKKMEKTQQHTFMDYIAPHVNFFLFDTNLIVGQVIAICLLTVMTSSTTMNWKSNTARNTI